jgi:hypothetical protein
MDYELAKQLKDAEFPQNTMWSYVAANIQSPENWTHCDVLTRSANEGDELIARPTLEELMEVCGDKFYSLTCFGNIYENPDLLK